MGQSSPPQEKRNLRCFGQNRLPLLFPCRASSGVEATKHDRGENSDKLAERRTFGSPVRAACLRRASDGFSLERHSHSASHCGNGSAGLPRTRVGLCATAVAAGLVARWPPACARPTGRPRASPWFSERGIFLFARSDPRGEKRLSRPRQGHLPLKVVSTLLAAAVHVRACLEVRKGWDGLHLFVMCGKSGDFRQGSPVYAALRLGMW
ncbi:hypothetical protein MRX96_019364 [Rhipicephalus microplus]